MIEPFQGCWPEIHPTAFVHPSAIVIGKVKIGPHASIWPTAVLRGDDGEIVIGEGTSIQDGCVVHLTYGLSKTTIGAYVTVGHRVVLHGCTVGERCIIGMGSVLLDNAEVAERVILGAGSLLPPGKKLPSGVLAFGNPAKVARELTSSDLEGIERSWQGYIENASVYKRQQSAAPEAAQRPALLQLMEHAAQEGAELESLLPQLRLLASTLGGGRG